MKKYICTILIFVMIIVFCACGTQLTHGEVYEKEHKEAFTTVMMMPIVVSNGKTTTTHIIPYVIYYPERWVIYIKAFNEEDNKWLTEDFYVKEEVYDQVNIGDMFEYDESRGDLTDEPYTKEKQ